MTLTLDKSVGFATVFIEPELSHENTFEKVRVKRMTQAERKVCHQALLLLLNARATDFDHIRQEGPAVDPAILQSIVKGLREDFVTNDYPISPWYQKPIFWVARAVRSIWLSVQNAFLGRISSNNLYNQIEAYRERFDKYQELTSENGKLRKRKEKVEKLAEERKVSIERLQGKGQESLSKRYVFFLQIGWKDYPESFNRIAAEKFNIPNHKEYDILTKPFRNTVEEGINKLSDELKLKIPNLIKVVEDEEASDREIFKVYHEEFEALGQDYLAHYEQMEKDTLKLEKALHKLDKTERKVDLLQKILGLKPE